MNLDKPIVEKSKSGHTRFVHSRGNLGMFLGCYSLDGFRDLRCIIELGEFVLPWAIFLHVPFYISWSQRRTVSADTAMPCLAWSVMASVAQLQRVRHQP